MTTLRAWLLGELGEWADLVPIIALIVFVGYMTVVAIKRRQKTTSMLRWGLPSMALTLAYLGWLHGRSVPEIGLQLLMAGAGVTVWILLIAGRDDKESS